MLFWPVADTLLAIYRRSRRNTDAMAPDKLHVHQMVKRALEICVPDRRIVKFSNPLSTLVLAPFILAPPAFGVMFWDRAEMAFVANLTFAVLFCTSYTIAPGLIRRFRRDTQARKCEDSRNPDQFSLEVS